MLSQADAGEVAAAFGFGANASLSPSPVARGEQGQVWRLDTARGAWAIKESFFPDDEDDDELALAAEFQEIAVSQGIPAPVIVRAVDGDLFALVGDGRVRAYTWVDMADVDTGLDPVAVGTLVGRLHGVSLTSDSPVHPWYTEPVGEEAWTKLVDNLRARGAHFADALAAYVPELVAMEAELCAPVELQVCHRDLWADNVRRWPDGGIGIIDWENAGSGSSSHELAMIAFEFARGDASRATALVSAYVAAGGVGRLVDRGSFTMTIAALGHIGEIACKQWLEADAGSDDAAHAEGRVAEFLDVRLTLAEIDSLLASAAEL